MIAIGIDLGTTNSVAAYCPPGGREAKVLTTSAGENLTPSVVSVRRGKGDDPGEILAGRPALNNALRAPQDTILSIKRLMGRDFDEPQVQAVRDRLNYPIVPGPDGDPRAHVRLNGKPCSPVEISAMILRKIKADAEQTLGEAVTHAVITVPAYFNEHQRAATREAGEQAGLGVRRIIDEPTAAAIAFGVDARAGARHRILVYDLGGGTFDISILQLVKDEQGEDHFQILQIEGDNWLGGDDFDRHIFDRVLAAVRAETDEDPTGDKRFLLLAKRHAEEAKRALGHSESAEIVIPAAYRSAGGLVDVELTVERAAFEAEIAAQVERSLELAHKAMREQELTPEEVTDVLLVGGSTLVPAVYQAVENHFGTKKVRRTFNPMECVARGAALLAARLRGAECPQCGARNDDAARACTKCGHSLVHPGRSAGGNILEVTAMALGIEAVADGRRDVFVPIIPKGTPYPLAEPMRERFKPTDEQRIKVPVFEGEHEVASKNAELGVIDYELPEEIDRESEVEVSFNYDLNRELTVRIAIPGTNLYTTATLHRDRPRMARAAGPEAEEEEESWQDQLADAIEYCRRFFDLYGAYMEVQSAHRLERDLERARALLVGEDEPEGRRMTRRLHLAMLNSGLATQLYLADRATEGGSEEARQITEAANQIRRLHDQGAHAEAEEKARLLKVLVAKTLERRASVGAITDAGEFDALLRALGH